MSRLSSKQRAARRRGKRVRYAFDFRAWREDCERRREAHRAWADAYWLEAAKKIVEVANHAMLNAGKP